MNFALAFLIISPLFFISLIFLISVFLKAILPTLFWGAPYIPSKKKIVKKMVDLANIKPGEKAADLGSGDGRLIIALAKVGAEAHGYEINPLLVSLARRNIRKARLTDKAFIHQKNFWHKSLSKFDVVTVYGIGYMMKRLEAKLKKELKKNARVISNSSSFPTWPQSGKESNVYLYKR